MLLPSQAAIRGRSIVLAAFVATLFLLGGCATGPRVVTPEPPPIPEGGDAVPEQNEIVLTDGTQLAANAPWGRIKIEAGPGLRRVYTWRDNRRGVILEPRNERFAGSMGIHYEGKPPVWEPAEGITQVDLEEGQRRFETVDDAMIWMQIRRLRYSYTNDGLVVGWKPKGDTLVVELWQFYIDGKKPTSLPGAEDSRFALGPVEVVPQRMSPVLVYSDGRTEPYIPPTTPTNDGNDDSSRTASSSQASNCNWFKNLFGNCADDASATDAADSVTAQGDSEAASQAAAAAAAANAAAASADANSAEAAEQEAAEAEDKAPKAEISAKVVNVRSGPGTSNDVVTQGKQGDSVVIRDEDGDWRYVEFSDGRKGWIADFLLDHED